MIGRGVPGPDRHTTSDRVQRWLARKGSVRALNHHRYAQWDAEWRQVEPRWSKRLPS
ncbi:hypothetical protein ACIRVF_35945 [Kitasatospora sp. NPDC101157]|uniref:hypothetical protein n=1 Tax=Kitasatospora sp. NPDC101157 TaxID=3364098 RepID=UPI0038029542